MRNIEFIKNNNLSFYHFIRVRYVTDLSFQERLESMSSEYLLYILTHYKNDHPKLFRSINDDIRMRHIYVSGLTGIGKSVKLENEFLGEFIHEEN